MRVLFTRTSSLGRVVAFCIPLLALCLLFRVGYAEGAATGDGQPDDTLEEALDGMLNRFLEDVRTGSPSPEWPSEPEPIRTNGQVLRLKPGWAINVVVSIAGEKDTEDLGKRISAEGDITLSLVGGVHVADLTLAEATELLTKSYGRYIRNPQVEVSFAFDETEEGRGVTSPWGSVTVLGRVKQPGPINIPPTQDLTLSTAIHECGGFDTSAKDRGITVTRKGADGSTEKLRVDLRGVAVRGERDIRLQDGDVVYVPERIF